MITQSKEKSLTSRVLYRYLKISEGYIYYLRNRVAEIRLDKFSRDAHVINLTLFNIIITDFYVFIFTK